jgi:hypothetical protein
MADKKSLEGQFQKFMRAGKYGENTYSPSDLDEVVSNFDPEGTGKTRVPVVFGKSDGAGPTVAQLSELRSDGDTLSGRMIEVDPRIEQLSRANKLGTRRSFTVKRTPAGLALDKVGIHGPRVYTNTVWQDGPGTDAALTDLAKAASTHHGTAAFDAGFAERVITFSEESTVEVPSVRGAICQVDKNSVELNALAVRRQREQSISFSEALTAVAAAHPELTVPSRGHSVEQHGEAFRFQTNSERLSELATQRAREDKTLSFGEALSQVAAENPRLTLPDGVISFEEEAPKSNGQKLTDLANKRMRQHHVSFGEALSAVAAEHPELALPDAR